MDQTTDITIQALTRLGRAAAMPGGDARQTAARSAETDINKLKPGAWLPREDILYYLGAAEFHAGSDDSADRHLAAVPLDNPFAGEAVWLRSVIVSRRIEAGSAQRAALYEVYRGLAERFPLCPLVQSVADFQTDQRAAAMPHSGPVAVPSVKVGRRYDWQTLSAIAGLYREQGMFEDAIRAYRWSVEVRFPAEWLSAAAVDAWGNIADCLEKLGKTDDARRYLAKCLALPLDAGRAARFADRMRNLASAAASRPASARPDKAALVDIADRLLAMEMFDQAIAAYHAAAAHGADIGLAIARTLEAKATFLFDYRSERTAATMLYDAPLTWERVAAAFTAAREEYRAVGASQRDAADAIQRCDAKLEQIYTEAAREH